LPNRRAAPPTRCAIPSHTDARTPGFGCCAAGSFFVPWGPREDDERDDEPRVLPLVERARDDVDRVLVAMASR